MRRSASREAQTVAADLARSLAHRRDFRAAMREIATYALRSDAASPERLRGVLDALALGISEGTAQSRVDPGLAVPEAFAGLEQAVEQFVSTEAGKPGRDAAWSDAVAALLIEAARHAHARASLRVREAWGGVLEARGQRGGTPAGGAAGGL